MEQIGKLTAASGVHHAIDQLSEAAGPTVSRAASGAHRLVDRLAGTGNRVTQQLQATGTRLKDAEQRLVGASSGYVREHPLKSVGIALAAGLLVSRLIISRHSPQSGKKPAEESKAPA